VKAKGLEPNLHPAEAMNWIWKHFDELNTHELYSALQLRSDVFIVEQKCIYHDLDGLDKQSWHLLGLDQKEEKLLATCRITPPGTRFPELSIGRVVVAPDRRGTGLGKELMTQAIATIEKTLGPQDIRLSAQTYLLKLYQQLGFEKTSDEYPEDGIPHYEMLRKASSSSCTFESKTNS